jgi:hypothetical protein
MVDDSRTRRLRELLTEWRQAQVDDGCDCESCIRCATEMQAVLDTEGDQPTPCVPGSHHPDCLCYRRPDPPVQP